MHADTHISHKEILGKISNGFTTIDIDDTLKESAYTGIQERLTNEMYADYVTDIHRLVEKEKRSTLIDCFYRTLPFGTGGRRGNVGIGPNRINATTIALCAQGHSTYLLDTYGEHAMTQGVIIAYDVRVYLETKEFGADSVVYGLSGKTLCEEAARVYAANGIRVRLFDTVASTPELAYLTRHLGAISGLVISASHNPPEYNGIKVYNQTGGQLIPPVDEQLIGYIENVTTLPSTTQTDPSLISLVSPAHRQAYIDFVCSMSLMEKDETKSAIVYFSPFHGTTYTSVTPVLTQCGFTVISDPETTVVDPTFSSILYNIPDPEVEQAYDILLPRADTHDADIILTCDPDGDRIGCMSKEEDGRQFFTGQEIAILCSAYLLDQRKKAGTLTPDHSMAKTVVTSDLIYKLAAHHDISIVGDLLVGFKYIGHEVNKLADQGLEELFLLGVEESHGISVGAMRDKGSACAALLLAELASVCKNTGTTMRGYLQILYSTYGYHLNYLTEIRLPGVAGVTQIQHIMRSLRTNPPASWGGYTIDRIEDKQEGAPFLSKTDESSRNVLVMHFAPTQETKTLSCVIRPSGTEPKIKFYFQIGRAPAALQDIAAEKEAAQAYMQAFEKEVLDRIYGILDISFPARGYLLFNKMPLDQKLHYFEIEEQIAALKDVASSEQKEKQLNELLGVFGANPIQKVEKAFEARFGVGILEYVGMG